MSETISFRCDDATVRALADEMKHSGSTKSDLLSQAVRELLYQRACERDAEAYAATPLTAEESAGWLDQHGTPDEPATDWSKIFGR